MRQINSKKKNGIQNSNLNVYKQLFDKERKQWLDEKEKTEQKVDQMQSACYKEAGEFKFIKEEVDKLREELVNRDEVEAKV